MKPLHTKRLRASALVLALVAGPTLLAHPAHLVQSEAQDAAQQKLDAIDKDFEQENKELRDRKSTRLNSSHSAKSRMPSSA